MINAKLAISNKPQKDQWKISVKKLTMSIKMLTD